MREDGSADYQKLPFMRNSVRGALAFVLILLLVAPAVSHAQEEEAQAPAPPAPAAEKKEEEAQPPAPAAEKKEEKRKPTFVVAAGQEVAIDSLLEQIGNMTGKSIVVAPNISGRRIKFVSSFEADYYILEAVLAVNGITLEHRDVQGTEMVASLTDRELRPIRYAPTPVIWIRDPEDIAKLPVDNELVTAIFEIKYADPTQVERTLTNRLLDRQGAGSVVSVTNQPVIIVKHFSPDVRYCAKLIQAIDIMPKSVEMRVYTLKYAVASEVAQYLQQLAQGARTGRPQPGTPTETGLEAQFVADTRTNKLIVLTFPENFDKIERVIRELDEELPEGTGNIHVYMLKHTDAVKMATALQSILSGQTQRQQRTVTPRGGVAPQLQAVPSRVVADEPNNALLIEAEKKDYDEIVRLIKVLDVRRPQVLLEAAIIEVSADSTTNMGIELATVDIAGTGFRGAGGSYFGLSTLDPENLTKQPLAGLGLTGLVYKDEFDRIPVLMQLLRTNSDVNVLSSPRILTNDNEQGEIKVTDQVATATYIDPQQGASRQQFGSYQEAGITLTITPHISTDDYLRLEIALKIDQFTSPPVAGSITPPPKTTRELKGLVTVPDREIIVIGGLTSEDDNEVVNKIPILGDIPFLGALFRNTSVTRRKKNLYVFLTPHIINEFDSLNKISRRQMEDARLLGAKVDSVSQILRDLPAYYARRRSKRYLELRDTLKDLFGRDFKKAFVIERPQMDKFYDE